MDFAKYFQRDPGVCGGETVITGTRVTLRTVLALAHLRRYFPRLSLLLPYNWHFGQTLLIRHCLEPNWRRTPTLPRSPVAQNRRRVPKASYGDQERTVTGDSLYPRL
jgi:hypothetical protein